MRLTKLGHACVRLDKDGGVLVIDPGAFSGDDALNGADAVLVTHEHFDHVVPDQMRAALTANPGLRLWAPAGVAEQFAEFGDRARAVSHGDELLHTPVGADAAAGSIDGTQSMVHSKTVVCFTADAHVGQ